MNPILWRPSKQRVRHSHMARFLKGVNREFGLHIHDYATLHRWSVKRLEQFWEYYLRQSGIDLTRPPKQTLSSRTMPGAVWFDGAELSYAANLLKGPGNKTAIISRSETRPTTHMTFDTLRHQVACFASALRRAGVEKGDRVAGYLPNIPETVIAMLGTAAVGAVWTSCSPDFGLQGVLARFGQVEPKVLVTVDGYTYNGKAHSLDDRIKQLVPQIKGLCDVVLVPYLNEQYDLSKLDLPSAVPWSEFAREGGDVELRFDPVGFNDPLFILYSSGTTGLPKGIVHGAGGTLLQHHKEHALHTDIGPEDVVFYYTTCGWMMWNWLVSALARQATIVLYEGSPAYPSIDVLWQLVEETGCTVFGTSPKFLAINREQGKVPGKTADLSSLKAILSTGSPLDREGFRYVYRAIKKDVQLSSICGGTDIISCFMLGNPILPVREEEIQCLGLGMDVAAFNAENQPVVGEQGELVCRSPAPSMPVAFWNDPDGARYRSAYFEKVPGVWVHGDYITITEEGGVIVYGRSDATLNPGGVRIGTAEIYRVVENLPEVEDSLVIGIEEAGDIHVLLFVVLAEGCTLDDALQARIRQALKTEESPRHVPHEIFQVREVPKTMNGKKVELAVRGVFSGTSPANLHVIANAGCLSEYEDLYGRRLALRGE
ncbi:acetoacetate--CoA ligase [Nitrospina gracilis]|uniref:acetoacetate--CoA ligase n=1 Tax=Nitrospina gracilis TaxID=35801 RepID=UPI001F017CC7|nr:acetoacetate--CoA ligase [Nitrospina gracilis]MCF8721423.1 acetoacetyl-CoA synthetase [Nitrospina gracilis Nb-211]